MKFIFALLMSIMLAGCSAEPDTLGVVEGTALDKGEKPVCMSVSVWRSGETICVRSEADTLVSAEELCAEMVSRELFFGHERVLLISDELAREGIWDILLDFYSENDKRGSELVAICKGNAAEALASVKCEDIADAIEFAAKNNGSPKCTLHDFIADTMESGIAEIPVIKADGAAAICGMAVLKDGRLM